MNVISPIEIILFILSVAGSQDVRDVKQVHLVFMNHLDVGYDGISPELGFVNNVLNKYFHVYFPRAIKVASELRGLGYNERMIYTTHAWLVSMFLDCPANMVLAEVKLKCPNVTEIEAFNKAVRLGDITWHAGPMNMQNEMLDPSMVDFSLQMVSDLHFYYNFSRPVKTLSQRDVPGMTQALLPIFSKHGIQGITVGVNGATLPPSVPKIFNWKYKNNSIIAMWHPGGYPNHPGYFPSMPGGLSAKDCVTYPGFHQALCFAFRNDNDGPPMSIQEVLLYYEISRNQFPNAFVQGSTFDGFVSAAQSIKDQLPVIEKEIGDVWIQGVASDPFKVAHMRAFYRARSDCLDKGVCLANDTKVYNSSRFLLKLAEHTWGINTVHDQTNWTNGNFYSLLAKNFTFFENGLKSWKGQRGFLDLALEALGKHPLADMVRLEWKQIQSYPPDYKDFEVVPDDVKLLTCDGGFQFEFSEEGYLTTLIDPTTKVNWASKTNPMGQFLYQTYNQTDFDAFDAASMPYSKHFFLGIGKPNLTKNSETESKFWPTKLIKRYRKNNQCDYLIHIKLVGIMPTYYYGAPADIWIRYTQPMNRFDLNIELQWYLKQPTRLPESLYYSFKPSVQSGYTYKINKIGQWIDPLNVVINGSQRLHALHEGVQYSKDLTGLQISSKDVALVTVLTSENEASVLPSPYKPIKDVTGVAFNLLNNVWNVNYIFWYPFLDQDVNQKFRFNMKFGDLTTV